MMMTVDHHDHDADDVDAAADDDDDDGGDHDDVFFSRKLRGARSSESVRWQNSTTAKGTSTARGRFTGPRLHHGLRGRPYVPYS